MYLLDGVSMMGWGCWRVLLGGNEVDEEREKNIQDRIKKKQDFNFNKEANI